MISKGTEAGAQIEIPWRPVVNHPREDGIIVQTRVREDGALVLRSGLRVAFYTADEASFLGDGDSDAGLSRIVDHEREAPVNQLFGLLMRPFYPELHLAHIQGRIASEPPANQGRYSGFGIEDIRDSDFTNRWIFPRGRGWGKRGFMPRRWMMRFYGRPF